MLDYVSGLRPHAGDRETAEKLLAHEDDQFELRRYEIPSAEHLIDYFSRLDTISPRPADSLFQPDELRLVHPGIAERGRKIFRRCQTCTSVL